MPDSLSQDISETRLERSLSKIRRADSMRAESEKDALQGELDALAKRVGDAFAGIEAVLEALPEYRNGKTVDRKLARDSISDTLADIVHNERERIESRIADLDEEVARADAP